MPEPIIGLHHVTAIASNPQQNLDFYTEVLGLRLVKRTINFDDPGTYHFYFGDDTGSPGTILTFFPWPHVNRGSMGVGETTATAFSVPAESLDYWERRLRSTGIPVEREELQFEHRVLKFIDLDGMKLELVGQIGGPEAMPARTSNVPPEHSISGFFGVTLCEAGFERTAEVLEKMGFWQAGVEGNRFRFSSASQARGSHIDVLVQPQLMYGRMGAGTVHHIAFRAPSDEAQLAWREELKGLGLDITPVLDRRYFQSVYFRESGGVLFEIATDPPGFLTGEPAESLGESLKLPPWYEPKRQLIEGVLPPITLQSRKSAAR